MSRAGSGKHGPGGEQDGRHQQHEECLDLAVGRDDHDEGQVREERGQLIEQFQRAGVLDGHLPLPGDHEERVHVVVGQVGPFADRVFFDEPLVEPVLLEPAGGGHEQPVVVILHVRRQEEPDEALTAEAQR